MNYTQQIEQICSLLKEATKSTDSFISKKTCDRIKNLAALEAIEFENVYRNGLWTIDVYYMKEQLFSAEVKPDGSVKLDTTPNFWMMEAWGSA